MVALKFGEEFFGGGGGGGPLNWEEVLMAVVCGEVSGRVGKFSTKMSSIRLGWGIE